MSLVVDPLVERAEELERRGETMQAGAVARDALAKLDARGARESDVIGALRVLTTVAREPADFERFVSLAARDDLTLDEAARLTAARVREFGDVVLAPLSVPLRIRLAKRLERLGDATMAAKVRPA